MEQMTRSTADEVRSVLWETLQIDPAHHPLPPEAGLFESIPEFDSMAVVHVITALEERLGIMVDDEEITAEIFETVGSLTTFVESKQ